MASKVYIVDVNRLRRLMFRFGIRGEKGARRVLARINLHKMDGTRPDATRGRRFGNSYHVTLEEMFGGAMRPKTLRLLDRRLFGMGVKFYLMSTKLGLREEERLVDARMNLTKRRAGERRKEKAEA